MVPASTLMYGSIFCRATRYPRASSSAPMDAAARPLPSEDTTPPVTKIYFAAKSSLPFSCEPLSNIVDFPGPIGDFPVEPAVAQLRERTRHSGSPRHPEGDHLLAAQRGLPRPFARRP